MKNLRVSMKLIISFSIVLVLAIVVGVIGIYGMYKINSADDDLYNENVVALSAMGHIREVLQGQRVQLRNIALNAGNPTEIQEVQKDLDMLDKEIEKYFIEYETTIIDTSGENEYFEAKEVYQNAFAGIKRDVINASYNSLEEAYSELFNPRVADLTDTMTSDFSKSMAHNDQWAREKVDGNTALFRTMLIIEIIMLILAVFAALFFAFYISSLISKPLIPLSSFMRKAGDTGDIDLSASDLEVIAKYSQNRDEIGETINGAASFIERITTISKDLETVADGNLTVNVKQLSDRDVIGRSLTRMLNNLNGMFGEIQSSTMQVSTGSKQMADGAQSLAQGSTEQAASVEELASSIAEIAERTKTNAQTAEMTAKLSDTIRENAEKSNDQMNDMIKAVGEITEASKSISQIIKTIDDIAFQTNILALNAAVEAARAGQHGKGFAVVAEEVRNLASKSAEAAKDTGDMIQNSVEKAELGAHIANETATSLKEIVTGINESSQLISEIARSSEEQSFGISQINAGIDQVAQVVQQNSATAEESAAASEEMSAQADMLQQLIGQFKLKDDGQAPNRPGSSDSYTNPGGGNGYNNF